MTYRDMGRDMARHFFFIALFPERFCFGLALNKFGRCSNRYVVALWGRHVRNGGKLA